MPRLGGAWPGRAWQGLYEQNGITTFTLNLRKRTTMTKLKTAMSALLPVADQLNLDDAQPESTFDLSLLSHKLAPTRRAVEELNKQLARTERLFCAVMEYRQEILKRRRHLIRIARTNAG